MNSCIVWRILTYSWTTFSNNLSPAACSTLSSVFLSSFKTDHFGQRCRLCTAMNSFLQIHLYVKEDLSNAPLFFSSKQSATVCTVGAGIQVKPIQEMYFSKLVLVWMFWVKPTGNSQYGFVVVWHIIVLSFLSSLTELLVS